MIASCMRCCSVSVTLTASPWSATSRSKSETPSPPAWAAAERTVGGQLEVVAGQHRPVGAQERQERRRLHRLGRLVHHRQREAPPGQRRRVEAGEGGQHHRGPVQHLGLGPRLERPRLGEQRPRLALGGPRLAEAPRAAPLPALAGVAAELERPLHQVAGDAARPRAPRRAPPGCGRGAPGSTRAGWPTRTPSIPAASSRSSRLSTARLEGAQASTRSPRAAARRITSTSTVVLPVPGGPWTSARSVGPVGEVERRGPAPR